MSLQNFVGQWVGPAKGSLNDGNLILNLEAEPREIRGSALYLETKPSTGRMLAPELRLEVNSSEPNQISGDTKLELLQPNGNTFKAEDDIQTQHPGIQFPDTVNFTASFLNGQLIVSITTEHGIQLSASLTKNKPVKPYVLPDRRVTDWNSFKELVSQLEPKKYIYRGQPQPWPLETLFHRKRRKDLLRYVREDVPKLSAMINAHTNKKIDLRDGPTAGATLYSIAQHHGYPTPMLDWTWSPFIAAFFAFRSLPADNKHDHARVFAFDRKSWERAHSIQPNFLSSIPMMAVVEAEPTENARLLPQQSIFTLTNVWDIEKFITDEETENATKFLHCFDIPLVERAPILHELKLMGLTAASLFPGLDGTCEALRGQMFGDLTEVPDNVL